MSFLTREKCSSGGKDGRFPWIPVIAVLSGLAGIRLGLDILRSKRQGITKEQEEDYVSQGLHLDKHKHRKDWRGC